MQRAAAALAQRKATARAAAEEAQQSGQGLKGPMHKQGPSSSFMSMSRDQVSLQSMSCCWHGHFVIRLCIIQPGFAMVQHDDAVLKGERLCIIAWAHQLNDIPVVSI